MVSVLTIGLHQDKAPVSAAAALQLLAEGGKLLPRNGNSTGCQTSACHVDYASVEKQPHGDR